MTVSPNPEGQSRLIEEIIDKGICVRCGACVGLCPYFHFFDGKVVVMDRCDADTWNCLQLCPRANIEDDILSVSKGIGSYKTVTMARAADREIRKNSQYGGTVSSIIISGLQSGQIESAVLTDRGGATSPEGRLARNRKDVLDCGGSRYSASGSLSILNKSIKDGEDRIAMVGVPCQMEALARMRKLMPDGEEWYGRVALKIGLFCTWALDYRQLDVFLKKEGVKDPVNKFDIPPPPSEVFRVQTRGERRGFPLSQIRPFVQKGCLLCQDMTAQEADLSVGTVEGVEGWNTVVLRTDKGVEIFNEAVDEGWLETHAFPADNLEHLKEAAQNKRERGKKSIIKRVRGQAWQ